MGANVNSGQVYGAWPGLASNKLYDNADLTGRPGWLVT